MAEEDAANPEAKAAELIRHRHEEDARVYAIAETMARKAMSYGFEHVMKLMVMNHERQKAAGSLFVSIPGPAERDETEMGDG